MAFTLEDITEDQDYPTIAETLFLDCPVHKPDSQEFVRVHPEMRLDRAYLIELHDDKNSLYLVTPAMKPALAKYCKPYSLHLAVTKHGVAFIWPIRLPGDDGKDNKYWLSARQAVIHARTDWVQVHTNLKAGRYEVAKALKDYGEPTWPDLPLIDILNVAFKDRLIDSKDCEAVAILLGAV